MPAESRTAPTQSLPTEHSSVRPERTPQRRVLDIDGCGLPLLGLEPAPTTARLAVVTLATRAADAVDVLGDDLIPDIRGHLGSLPFEDAAFDAVAVAGTLEHVVADDDALDEMARVLRPHGLLFLRVPRDDRFAWFDAQNLFTYIAGTSKRGEPLAGRPALRFRRHYGRGELLGELQRRGMRPRVVTTEGWGIGEGLYLAMLLSCRWLLQSPEAERRVRAAIDPLVRAERRIQAGRFGRDLVVVAERRSPPDANPAVADQASSPNGDRSSGDS